IVADARDAEQLAAAVAGHEWDAVVQWIGFTPEHVAQDVPVFRDAGQYVFISSATVYRKPPPSYLVREDSTPLGNPYWRYSQNKIACEDLLRTAEEESGFPVTIVRPSFTYGVSQVPLPVSSWDRPYTIIDRMRRGARILVPGDGTGLWVLTH